MSISVSCLCGRGYRVANHHAGRQFRCKSCGEAVVVPLNDWSAGDDYAYDRLPRPRKKSRSRRRQRNMPASVIVAIAGESVLIPFNLVSMVGNLAAMKVVAVFFCLLRIGFEVACIIGFTKRQRQARWASIVLSGLGLLFMTLGVIVLLNGESVFRDIPPEGRRFLALLLLFQMAIYVTLIVSLVMPSAAEYLDS